MIRATALSAAFVLCGAVTGAQDGASPTPMLPSGGDAVILFLLDNSASLPPLDPSTQRREALEKIYGFLQGQPYRLILFGGRQEIHVDDVDHYRNSGQWTDFYFAFLKAKELMAEYPPGTAFKMVLITDGIIDPSPQDWLDQFVVPGSDLTRVATERTQKVLSELGNALYVILIGDEVEHGAIEQLVLAANGRIAASEYAQGIADFFEDDGMLLRRFIFRVEPDQGLEQIQPIVQRIATPPRVGLEVTIAGSLILLIGVLVGVGVRSFPGPGDRELIEMRVGEQVYVAVDQLRRLPSEAASWSWKGLSIVSGSKKARAVLTVHDSSTELPPDGVDASKMDPPASELIGLPLDGLRSRLDQLSKSASKEDQILALNLDYVARDLDPAAVEKILTTPVESRGRIRGMEFLRAKAHLLHNPELSRRVTSPKVVYKIFGDGAQEKELRAGTRIKLGRYGFRVEDLRKGGRKDFCLELAYEKVPSPLWLKRIIPRAIQKTLRLRRTHERIVS